MNTNKTYSVDYDSIIDNFNLYTDCILDTLQEVLPQERKPQYEPVYYIACFILVKNNLQKWEDLVHSRYYQGSIFNKKHWKSIENKYRLWCKFDVFKIACNKLINMMHPLLTYNYSKKKEDLILLIDVVKINNKRGSQNIGINSEYPKKNVTELLSISHNIHTICVLPLQSKIKIYDTHYTPTCIKKIKKQQKQSFKNIQNKYLIKKLQKIQKNENKIQETKKQFNMKLNKNNKNKKSTHQKEKEQHRYMEKLIKIDQELDQYLKECDEHIKKSNNDVIIKTENKITKENKIWEEKREFLNKTRVKTFEHETKKIQEALNLVSINTDQFKNIYLIGDKAYNIGVNKNQFNLNNKKVTLIAPKKKNDPVKSTTFQQELLKGRHFIENSFVNLKNNDRTYVRKDKNIKNYMGFIELTIMETYLKKFQV